MKILKIIFVFLLLSSQLKAIEDLSKLSWTEAFEIVHSNVKTYYPFIEHKKINLDSLYTVTSLAIKKAEQENNDTAYFIAIRSYAHAFRDNHVFAKRKGFNLNTEKLTGHVGFEIVELENGDIVVSQIREGANNLPEEIAVGSKIIEWKHTPIREAIANTSMLSEERMEATTKNKFLRQFELLMYSPIGSKVNVTIENAEGKTTSIVLSVYPVKDLKSAIVYPKQTLWGKTMQSPVKFDVFDDDSIGYFQLASFMPNLNDFSIPSTFQNKLWLLKQLNINSLIIDLRGNWGGVDTWAEKIAGHFVNEQKHYQYVSKYDDKSGQFVIDSSKTSIIKPQKPYFDKQIVILVDNLTVSTGEGLPMVLKDLPNVTIMGQYGTAGAFATGFSDFIFKLPEDVAFGFFEGRSLDQDGNIQVDANYLGLGGIYPEVKIPVSIESINSQYVENEDYVLEYAKDYLSKTK